MNQMHDPVLCNHASLCKYSSLCSFFAILLCNHSSLCNTSSSNSLGCRSHLTDYDDQPSVQVTSESDYDDQRVCRHGIQFADMEFSAGVEHRHFVQVPAGATWAELTVRAGTFDTPKQFMIHATQLLPQERYVPSLGPVCLYPVFFDLFECCSGGT